MTKTPIKNLQDLRIAKGLRVLVRCDLNLPQDVNGEFTDLFRLESSLPTISYLIERGATIFVTSHLGSPKGRVDPRFSLKEVAKLISNKLGKDVEFVKDPFDNSLDLFKKEGLFLIDNLRFWPGEEESSVEFAQDLIRATSSDIFVQDAFGVCHRSHASLTKLPELIPAYAGMLLQKEIEFLSVPEANNLNLIIGGAKVESKLPVIENFINKSNSILTGGVVANTFLKASGEDIASSLYSEDTLDLAKQIQASVLSSKTELLIPIDYSVAESPESLSALEVDSDSLEDQQMILDLGSKTISEYEARLKKSKTIIWAGTLGFAENPIFAGASQKVLNQILELKVQNNDLKIVIGGGDTVDFVRSTLDGSQLNLIDHLSTGGGASLLMLSGQELPGIKALQSSPISISSSEKSEIPKQRSSSLAPVLIANLKSNFNITQLNLWIEELIASTKIDFLALDLSVAVPNIFIEEASAKIGDNIKVIGQDISEHEEGAHTGEIAASMLKGIASGTLIGHSERRFGSGENLVVTSNKIERAINSGLEIILCVGSKSKDPNTHKAEVYDQLTSALVKFNSQTASLLTVAYEPVFAIGTGDVPTDDFLEDQLISIRLSLEDSNFNPKVIYGGSITSSNAKQILEIGFDGLLVGSASLKVSNLEDIGINMLA